MIDLCENGLMKIYLYDMLGALEFVWMSYLILHEIQGFFVTASANA